MLQRSLLSEALPSKFHIQKTPATLLSTITSDIPDFYAQPRPDATEPCPTAVHIPSSQTGARLLPFNSPILFGVSSPCADSSSNSHHPGDFSRRV